MLGYLYAIQGFLHNASGSPGEAYEFALQVAKLGKQYNYDDLISIGYPIIGDIFLSLETPSKACKYFQQGVKFGRHEIWGLDNRIRLGYSQIRDGQTEIGIKISGKGFPKLRHLVLGSLKYLKFNSFVPHPPSSRIGNK